MVFVHFWCCKMQYFQSFPGALPPGPLLGPCPGPTGGLKAPPRPPAARGNDLTVIAYRACGTIIPTQTYPSPSTNSYTQSKTLQYPTNFSSTFGAVGQDSITIPQDKPLGLEGAKTLPLGQSLCTKTLPSGQNKEQKPYPQDIKLVNFTNISVNSDII